jgi:FkbH-like protein
MNSSKLKALQQQSELLELVRSEPTYRNYWSAYKRIKKIDFANVDFSSEQRVNIAILSSFTIDPLVACLDIDCRLSDIFPEIYIAPFNRYQEEILDEQSGLYQSRPDIIFFFVQVESLLDTKFRIDFSRLETEHKRAELDRIIKHLEQLLTLLTQRTDALVIFSNFIVPSFSPLGIIDNKQNIGFKRFYQLLNRKLENHFLNDNQIFIFDLNEVASRHGKDRTVNHSMYYRGSLLFTESFLPRVSHECMGYVKALKSKNRKCLVLDLDNTIWGGIIGEDGLEGIKLNVNYPGNEFVDFQKSILGLYNKGIILAVNSKNNPEDALDVFREHPSMVIKEENLAAYRINWNDKVQNLIELAKEINIGLDSMVFIDDNPVERARVRTSLPDVLVVEMPSSPALFRKTLEDLNDFNTLSMTKEDIKRGEMYLAKRKRRDLEQNVQSVDEFIKSLEIFVDIRLADSFMLPRVTSLLNRTNQFNLTTRRYTESEVNQMHDNSEKILISTLQVRDKFGDEGIVGVVIIRKESAEKWFIDSFLMSCRVIGRKIETTFLYKIIKDARQQGVKNLESEYIPTKKNPLVKNFYEKHGFKPVEKRNDGYSRWILHPLETELEYHEYHQVVDDDDRSRSKSDN